MFGVFPGGWFEEGADRDATLLTSTYGLIAVVLTAAVALTWGMLPVGSVQTEGLSGAIACSAA